MLQEGEPFIEILKFEVGTHSQKFNPKLLWPVLSPFCIRGSTPAPVSRRKAKYWNRDFIELGQHSEERRRNRPVCLRMVERSYGTDTG